MHGYVVTVEFEVRPVDIDRFLQLVTANANASVETETGCRKFDVVRPKEGAGKVFLYEIYDNQAAFDAHKRTVHFASFDRDSAPLVLNKTVVVGDLHFDGNKDRFGVRRMGGSQR